MRDPEGGGAVVAVWREFDRWGRAERRWSANTAAQYLRRCRAGDLWLRQHDVHSLARGRPESWRSWWDTLPDTPASRNLGRKALLAFGCFLVDTGRRKANPAERIPTWRAPRSVPRPLSAEEAQRVRLLVRQTTSPAGTGVALMLWCGLRISETANLAWQDYDGHWLHVVGKGGHARAVPAPAEVQQVLRRWRLACSSPQWVLPGRYGPMSVGWLRQQVEALTGHTPHTYRHTYATALLDRTGDLRMVQTALGHASVATTAGYTKSNPSRMAEAVELMYG